MDIFNIPKKINRHVFKAICFLQGSKKEFFSTGAIAKQVKIQMAKTRCKPIRNVDTTIHKSLINLANMGLVTKSGMTYSVAFSLTQPRAVPDVPGRPPSLENIRRRSFTRMDPENPTTKLVTPDSLSGNEQEKARKIFRPIKRVVKKKKQVPRPQRGHKKPGRGFKPRKMSLKAKDKIQYQKVICLECRSGLDSNISSENMMSFGNLPSTSQDLHMDVDQNDVYDDKNMHEGPSHDMNGSQTTSRPFQLGIFDQIPKSVEANLDQKSSGHELKSGGSSTLFMQSSSCSMITLKAIDSSMHIWYPGQMSMPAPVETPSFTSVGNKISTSQTSVAQGAQDSVGEKSNSPTFFNPVSLDVLYMRQMFSNVDSDHSDSNSCEPDSCCQVSGVESKESAQEPGLNPSSESLTGQDSRASLGVKSSKSAQEPGLKPLTESLNGQDSQTLIEAKSSESALEPTTSKDNSSGAVTPQSGKSNYDFYK